MSYHRLPLLTQLLTNQSNQSGIQTLLNAEKEAHSIVQEARQYRTQRLKAAKTDAATDIQEYKTTKEAELKKYEEEHSGLNEVIDKEAEEAVAKELVSIKKTASEKKAQVVKLLVDAVIKPTPELHINA